MTSFTEQFAAASWLVNKRGTIPALACVLVDADQKTMAFTDMDILLTLRDVPITGTGKQLFNAARLAQLLSAVNDGFKSLALTGDQLTIEAARTYTLKANGPQPADFPLMNCAAAAFNATLPKAAFMIPSHAMSKEETRHYLNGLFVCVKDGTIKTVATDGHRLCAHDTGIKSEQFDGFIIPRKAINLIGKVISDEAVIATEFCGDKNDKARLTCGNIEIITKLIDGTFPEYEKVVPDPEKATATLKADWPAVATFCAATADHGRGVELRFGSDSMDLCAEEAEGDINLTLPCTGTGLFDVIGFNRRYLGDIASALPEGVTAYFTDNTSPVLFLNGPDTHVLMPMRV